MAAGSLHFAHHASATVHGEHIYKCDEKMQILRFSAKVDKSLRLKSCIPKRTDRPVRSIDPSRPAMTTLPMAIVAQVAHGDTVAGSPWWHKWPMVAQVGAMSWEQGDGELGAGVTPEITLAIDDSICVFKF